MFLQGNERGPHRFMEFPPRPAVHRLQSHRHWTPRRYAEGVIQTARELASVGCSNIHHTICSFSLRDLGLIILTFVSPCFQSPLRYEVTLLCTMVFRNNGKATDELLEINFSVPCCQGLVINEEEFPTINQTRYIVEVGLLSCLRIDATYSDALE